jgi:hypothetical protein
VTGWLVELRAALRQVPRDPTTALAAPTTMGIAIGACGAMFAVVRGVIVRPLAYGHPDELVRVWETHQGATPAFAGVALLLAAIGLYGALAYSLGRRRREMGIRTALGARPAHIAGLLVREATLVVVAGAAAACVVPVWRAIRLDPTVALRID